METVRRGEQLPCEDIAGVREFLDGGGDVLVLQRHLSVLQQLVSHINAEVKDIKLRSLDTS